MTNGQRGLSRAARLRSIAAWVLASCAVLAVPIGCAGPGLEPPKDRAAGGAGQAAGGGGQVAPPVDGGAPAAGSAGIGFNNGDNGEDPDVIIDGPEGSQDGGSPDAGLGDAGLADEDDAGI